MQLDRYELFSFHFLVLQLIAIIMRASILDKAAALHKLIQSVRLLVQATQRFAFVFSTNMFLAFYPFLRSACVSVLVLRLLFCRQLLPSTISLEYGFMVSMGQRHIPAAIRC